MAKKNTKEIEGVSTEAPEKVAAKKSAKNKRSSIVAAIMGIGMLLSVISIAYSTTTIVLGTEGYVPLVMIAPQATLALAILTKRFTK